VEIRLLPSAGTAASLTDYVTPRQTEDTEGHTEQHRSDATVGTPGTPGPNSVHSARPNSEFPKRRLHFGLIVTYRSPADSVFRQALLLGKKNRAGFTLPGEIDFGSWVRVTN
jgi:hypothetical protein